MSISCLSSCGVVFMQQLLTQKGFVKHEKGLRSLHIGEVHPCFPPCPCLCCDPRHTGFPPDSFVPLDTNRKLAMFFFSMTHLQEKSGCLLILFIFHHVDWEYILIPPLHIINILHVCGKGSVFFFFLQCYCYFSFSNIMQP